ncbi:balbiani ring protein 3-like [Scylla paramamosain]|uniref:balbiani ring protein 3-like n=1 Tax=Scylla paramamosain TaxID=85552 RepID=UPI0030831065
MKIVLLLTLVAVLCYGSRPKCMTDRNQLKFWYKQRTLTSCNKPKESFVQLKVPDGFDYVKPSVVKIPQCTGLFCSNYPMKCVPGESETRNLIVEAFTKGADHQPTCVHVSVEEHLDCKCDCEETTCEQNEIFDDDTCSCQCHPTYKRQCQERIDAGHRVRWSKNACACLCSHPIDCDNSMEWNHFLCECVPSKRLVLDSLSNELF